MCCRCPRIAPAGQARQARAEKTGRKAGRKAGRAGARQAQDAGSAQRRGGRQGAGGQCQEGQARVACQHAAARELWASDENPSSCSGTARGQTLLDPLIC
eukprot:121237-Chlamydomonas_euryale.AAC.1